MCESERKASLSCRKEKALLDIPTILKAGMVSRGLSTCFPITFPEKNKIKHICGAMYEFQGPYSFLW